MRFPLKSTILAAGIAGAALLGGCVDDGYGYGGGRVAVGYNAGWGDPYWGWYGDYYYPGTGYYVYDRYRARHRWNDVQRGYWEGRRGTWRGDQRWRSNWRDFGPRRRR
ncbi:hypothetical protein [Sphingomonas kyeonggiensis]|jgi:hypothetical protein|uniref:Alkanesulfonate monooxygenase SsuD/methylene tetrahydromethanopterin reductase-like flavin-dependent oxidoreductase (Luciferase family) n=1 Tax=Sphingomonas kyeonggiensis TaxID=1268553 RepID=A0A7W6NX88_9SPHN|nr:hypothetical protein [Sphingomonas kyeonggiensis]MBB4098451.1 alkanesulfonate monooxygenase SsuD/methylene tetrahydromethanopterin reductase-like flavin-dependent oxidoreductase (luciferase family) [Sphingomonas kyeonggiensis]